MEPVQNPQTPTKSSKKYIYIILIILVLAAVGVSAYFVLGVSKNKPKATISQPKVATKSAAPSAKKEEKKTDKFIVANPLDLSQISKISKFRSCSGHDYSGDNVNGKKETNRSMKHYIQPIDSLIGSTGKIKVFAPFDGKIVSIQREENPRGKQVWLTTPSSSEDWIFVFFHIDLASRLKVGSKVKSGQPLGYGNINNTVNFDYALQKLEGITIKQFNELVKKFERGEIQVSDDATYADFGYKNAKDIYDSPFNHFGEKVAAQYQKRGVTTKNIIIPKATRDKSPCNYSIQAPDSPDDWVVLQ
jgi:hypothetical protein